MDIRIGRDRHDVFSTAKRLNPLAGCAAALVNIFGRGGGADKGDTFDIRMIKQSVDHIAGPVNHVEHPFGQTDLVDNFKNLGLGHGHQFRRFNNEGIAADNRIGQKPPRHHARKVVGNDAGEDTQWLSMAHAVNVFGDVFQGVAGHQGRNTGGVFDIFDHAPDLTAGFVDALALFGGQHPGNFFKIIFKGIFDSK